MTDDEGGAVTAIEDEVLRAAEEGAADARSGSPMKMRYWHSPDEIKDAYANAYNAVMNPPRVRRASARVSRKEKPPKASLRVWKTPPS